MRALRMLVAAGLFTSPLSAQIGAYARAEGPTNLIIGMRSDVTFAQLPGANGLSSKPGYTFGPQIGVPLNKWFAIQTEILYTNIGAGSSLYSYGYGSSLYPGFSGNGFIGGNQFGNPIGQFNYGAPASAQYLQIPVLARFSLGSIGPVTPVLYAGPMAQWMFSCTSGFNPYTGDGVGCGSELIQAGQPGSPLLGMSRWDVGGMVGAGFNFNFGDYITVGSDVTYQRGLRQVSPLFPDFRNQAVSIAFRLGAGNKLMPWGREGGSTDVGQQDQFNPRGAVRKSASTPGVAPGVRM